MVPTQSFSIRPWAQRTFLYPLLHHWDSGSPPPPPTLERPYFPSNFLACLHLLSTTFCRTTVLSVPGTHPLSKPSPMCQHPSVSLRASASGPGATPLEMVRPGLHPGSATFQLCMWPGHFLPSELLQPNTLPLLVSGTSLLWGNIPSAFSPLG